MDFVVIKGYTYFFMMMIAAILMVWYIWYLYGNKDRSRRYEEFSNLVLHDELGDTPLEARDRTGNNPQVVKKDER